jgi:hypothetical protein
MDPCLSGLRRHLPVLLFVYEWGLRAIDEQNRQDAP